MQRKYNMALQHFYQAATHSTTDDVKARLKDLSDSEEELFSMEKEKEEYYEMDEKNSDMNENTYFTFKKNMSVKRVKPVGVCTLRGCGMLLLWLLLFLLGVLSATYFLQIAIGKIKPRNEHNSYTVYGRYNESKNRKIKLTNYSNDSLKMCSDFHVEKVWHQTYEKFQTESAIRLVDVNGDGVDDIISGFVTSLDGYGKIGDRKEVCEKYFNGIFPCFGGIVASDGKTGDQLWIHYSWHDVYALNCNGDIDKDGVADCLCAGRGGVFEAVSGKEGKMLWVFLDSHFRDEMMNLYTPQFINDVDHDGVMDVLQIHGGDPQAEPFSKKRRAGKILFLSGKTGIVLSSQEIPDNTESYFSPVIYNLRNGSEVVIYGNGGETHKGSLFGILLKDLYKGEVEKSWKILSNKKKGYMNPPILVDINKDGVVDIISAGFGEFIQAVDGETFQVLWTYSAPNSETYSIPGVGYYNEDDVVDFIIRISVGTGFPVYFYSKVVIIDGKTGRPLTKPYKTSAPAHSSPLSVSMEGTGNDLFVYWSVDCKEHEHEGGAYKFVKGTNVHESSRADSCMLRYNTTSFSKLYVMNRKTGFPGKEIYFSDDYFNIEHGIYRRHIGIPDHGGVQRVLQTGSIVPSLNVNTSHELSESFDVVFAMYFITPPAVRAILPSDVKCIKDFRRKAKKGQKTNSVDIDENLRLGIYDEGDSAVNFCLGKRLNGTKFDDQETANKKNFNTGKLTFYRFKVSCKCEHGEKCAKVLPKSEQGWTGYMGSLANGYFNQRSKGRFEVKTKA